MKHAARRKGAIPLPARARVRWDGRGDAILPGTALGFVALALAVGIRGVSFVRVRHRAPLLAGAVAGAAGTLAVDVAGHEPRAVPVLVVALVVVARGISARLTHGVGPVTAGRLRPLGRAVERVAVVAVPVCAAGVLGLYGRVWERFV